MVRRGGSATHDRNAGKLSSAEGGKKADYTKYRTVISRAKAYYEIMGAFADNCRQLSANKKKSNERVE